LQCCFEGFIGKELTTPNVRRAAERNAMRDHDIPQRRASRLVGVDPKTVRRVQTPTARQYIENARAGDNPEVREKMKAIASKRRRFGYRRIGVLLERKGMTVNHKKLYRRYS
jgi:putative transposase